MSDDTTSVAPVLNSKLLMASSAVFLGGLGVGTSLFSGELLSFLGIQPSETALLLVSVIGALYLGFAGLNWMARQHLVGGIYARPVAIGNFIHFFAAAIAIGKQAVTGAAGLPLALVAGGYVIFAAGFGYVLFAGGQRCG